MTHKATISISTDCRSEAGITTGLIDAIIVLLRILRGRDFSPPEVQEALKDLAGDEDFAFLGDRMNEVK